MNWRQFWHDWGWLLIGGAVLFVAMVVVELWFPHSLGDLAWLEMVHGIR